MSIITSEFNYPRKSHRVDFPFFIEIGGKSYRAKDWSLTGVGLQDFDLEVKPGQRFEARAVLPMVDSVLTLNVTMVFRAHHGGEVAGFEFVDLTPRTKRILRHYIELAVEGRIDNLEDLVAVATTPGIRSPLEDALNLTELESEGLLKDFRRKSTVALVLGALFIVGVVGVLFYNTTYRVQAIGFVAGNLERVTANRDGVIQNLAVGEKAFVAAGTPLFQVRDPDAQARLTAVDAQLSRLETLPLQMPLESPRQEAASPALLGTLRDEYEARRKEYENAQQLHGERVINNKDLAVARNHYLQARANLLREEAQSTVRRQPAAMRTDFALVRELETLRAERAALAQGTGASPVMAPEKGRVHRVAKTAGEFVRADEPVILLERDVKPYVLVRLLAEDALKLRIGMPAEIYVPQEGRNHAGRVTAVGHAAVNADMTESMEGSLNETLVKVEFDDGRVRLPPNTRVKVWIRTWNNAA